VTREAVVAVRDARGEESCREVAVCGSRALIGSRPVEASNAVRVRSASEKSCMVRGLHEAGINGGTDQFIAPLIG